MSKKHKDVSGGGHIWAAVDFGFSAAKVIVEKDGSRKQFVIPSAVSREAHGVVKIGDDAIRGSTSHRNVDDTNSLIQYYPVFVRKAFEIAGISGDSNIQLVVGVPADIYIASDGWEGDQIELLSGALSSIDGVDKVIVAPQGLGGVRDAIDSGALSGVASDSDDLVIGVDIGFNTLIQTVLDSSAQSVLTAHTGYGQGVSCMVEKHLLPRIGSMLAGNTVTNTLVSRIMRSGKIPNGMSSIDIKKELEDASAEYAATVIESIDATIRRSAFRSAIDSIVFFGGGCTYMRELVRSTEGFVLLEEPEFANVRGFLGMLKTAVGGDGHE